jgi:hypothetical protein
VPLPIVAVIVTVMLIPQSLAYALLGADGQPEVTTNGTAYRLADAISSLTVSHGCRVHAPRESLFTTGQ